MYTRNQNVHVYNIVLFFGNHQLPNLHLYITHSSSQYLLQLFCLTSYNALLSNCSSRAPLGGERWVVCCDTGFIATVGQLLISQIESDTVRVIAAVKTTLDQYVVYKIFFSLSVILVTLCFLHSTSGNLQVSVTHNYTTT